VQMESPALGRKIREHKWIFVLTSLCLLIVVAAVWLSYHFSPILKRRAEQALGDRFDSEVELRDFHASLLNLKISGGGLVLRYHGRHDVPPLISVEKFSGESTLTGLVRRPLHITNVKVDGMVIQIPPRRKREELNRNQTDIQDAHDDNGTPDPQSPASRLIIDELLCSNAQLITLTDQPDKEPKVWDIHDVVMHGLGLGHAASFHATLTNGVPPGEIHSDGEFGPWAREDPATTPVKGDYEFRNADLSVFRGIGGTLSSDGRYDGPLNNLHVSGTTDIPDFYVSIAGHKVHLSTQFDATVDGSNGDTLLHPVIAQFLKSSLTANGGVLKVKANKGKEIDLDIDLSNGRLEDLMALGVKGKPPMTGTISLTTKFRLPSGKGENTDMIERLALDGQFGIRQGQFTELKIQEKVKSLSRHGLGQPKDEDAGSAVTQLKGRFLLHNAVLTFRDLNFGVDGATVQLHGTYGLLNEDLDFHGKLRLDAKLSQMTTGMKSFLLKAFDPFFRKNGATELPIKITGKRDHPSFGLDFGHKDEDDQKKAQSMAPVRPFSGNRSSQRD
jgi:hypothetical protein